MFQTADGVGLNVVDDGGPGEPFVFQHGLGGDVFQTGKVFPKRSDFRRVTVECRGHGKSQSGPASAFSLQRFADDIAEYITAKLSPPVVLGGISMGAAISQILAVSRPELVRALVIARPAWLFDASPSNMEPNAVAGEVLVNCPGQDALDRFHATEPARMLAASAPDNLATLIGFFSRTDRRVLGELLIAISADGPRMEPIEAANIAVPTLIIGTEDDFIHPFAFAERLAKTIPKAHLIRITSKSADRTEYAREFRNELSVFLSRI